MNTHADKTLENKSQTVANRLPKLQSKSESTFQFVDNRQEAIAQRKLQEAISNSPRVQQLKAYQERANNSPQVSQLRTIQDRANNSPQFSKAAQLQAMADNHSAQQQQPIQKKENNTGLQDNLKTGMENLSGMSFDDVKVHRNSDKPAQLQAHAYAQGTDIHLGPGQEKHLPHEAWHVVQQKQGRVKPTMQMMGKVNVNDDAGLEKEADVMGAKAENGFKLNNVLALKSNQFDEQSQVAQRKLKGFEGKSSGFFKKGQRDKLNEIIKAYNDTNIANLTENGDENKEMIHEGAQTGMNALYHIQQFATKWLESITKKEEKQEEIKNWYKTEFLNEFTRVDKKLKETGESKELNKVGKVPKKIDEILGKNTEQQEFKDKRVSPTDISGKDETFNVKWEIIDSTQYKVTEKVKVYRVANTDSPDELPSYDPQSARSIRTKVKGIPNVSELQSYGHVYFAFDKQTTAIYKNMLNPERTRVEAEYELPVGFIFIRDPEIPSGFRSTSPMPKSVKITEIK